jgi:hypothetical protein
MLHRTTSNSSSQVSNTQKNLYGCYFDLTLSDNSHFTGQILLLARSPDAARASTNEWLRTERPWRSDEDDMRIVTAGGAESEELLTEFGVSVSLTND